MVSAPDLVSVRIGGQRFSGWTAVSLDRRLDCLAAQFDLSLTERWPGQSERWVIKEGADCEVLIGEDLALTGYLDDPDYEIDGRRHSISFTGHDRTVDLTECSAMARPGSWTGRRLEQIAADLCKPFGIAVKTLVDTGAPIASFALQQGETVFAAIERMTQQRGVLATTDETGNLVFRRPGQARADYALELGVNIRSIRRSGSLRDRFSDYHIKGQAHGDGVSGTDAARPTASAKDPGVPRYRPLIIVNGEDGSAATLAQRAAYEASVRAGHGRTITIAVAGWRTPSGDLYRPDVLVPVSAPLLGVEEDLLLAGVRLSIDERGRAAELTLCPKEAFSLLAVPPPKKPKRSRRK